MASPANNNSSSSPPIPNRPNPKPRNSEVSDPLRRSFGGNPFPANSRINIPSDLSRRKSFGGRENSRLEFSDKENETKPLPTPKGGSKNFMSPTISAVSKINASPRKKVLSDKNEWSRSTDARGLISEETKSHHNGLDIVVGIDEKKRFEGSHDMTVTDFDENEVHEEKGIVYSDPRFRISPRPSVPYASPEFADREADTLLPPYDPKRNYLSPRPQFLHYRPNPRIEKGFDESKQLEELFISESSSSDTELSVEEQEKDAPLEGGTEGEVEGEREDVEQLEAESDEEEMVCESTEETSQVPKRSGFKRFKLFGWFLALAMASLLVSATFSPPTEFLKESPFSEFHIPREITEFAKANNLEQLSEKLWTLTESSLAYMDKLISRLGRGAEEYGPMKFHNLTYILEDDTVFKPTSFEISEEPLQEKIGDENNLEDGYDNEFEEESGGEESSEVVSETNDGDSESNEFDEETEMKPGTDIEWNGGEGNSEALFVDRNNEEQRESEVNPEEKLETESTKKEEEAESEAIYINQHDVETAAIIVHQQEESEVAHAESGSEDGSRETTVETSDDLHPKLQQTKVADAESESQKGFSEIAAETSDDLHPKLQLSEMADAESESEEGSGDIAAETSDDLHHKVRSFNKAIIVSSSTVLVLLAAVAFLFSKKAKPVAEAAPEPALEAEELSSSHVPVEKKLMKEKLSSPNLLAEEEVDDRISNSFHKKSSFLSSNRDSKEDQSGGVGKKRRESMASSASEYSVGSFSYGSFTTYEKIPIKSGDREEEMITPVRRSSRIRNKPLGQ